LVSPVLIPSYARISKAVATSNPRIYFAKLWVIAVVVVWHVETEIVRCCLFAACPTFVLSLVVRWDGI
jgi:hypothetical protein